MSRAGLISQARSKNNNRGLKSFLELAGSPVAPATYLLA